MCDFTEFDSDLPFALNEFLKLSMHSEQCAISGF